MQRPFGLGFEDNYLHLRAPAKSDIAGRLADHLKRGVRRNRRTQRIDVASEIHDGAANQPVYAQPMSVMRLPPAAFRLAASACVVMPIAAQTAAVIAIVRAIVMLSPLCLAVSGKFASKTSKIDVAQPFQTTVGFAAPLIPRLRFVGRMSAFGGNLLQNSFEGVARAILIQDQTKMSNVDSPHRPIGFRLLRYRNAAKSFATHSGVKQT